MASRKLKFCEFVESIQKNFKPSIYLALNPTFIKNPYLSNFPKRFFFEDFDHKWSFLSLIANIMYVWMKNTVSLAINFALFCLFKLKISRKIDFSETELIIDTFLRIDLLPTKLTYADNLYFPGLFEKMEAERIKFCFLPRLINQNHNCRNPFHLISLIKKLNDFPDFKMLLEFDLLKTSDYLEMLWMILITPISPVSYLQKENSKEKSLFNACLIDDIRNFDFESIKRYFVARRAGKAPKLSAVMSWCENQSIDRAFNYGIRESGFAGKIIGCQLFLNYLSYLNSEPSDLDHQQKNAPDVVVVNGKAYLKKLERIKYELGESLRYKKIFSTHLDHEKLETKGVVILSSYIQEDTKHMIKIASILQENILLKLHPTQSPDMFRNYLSPNCSFTESSIYELFKDNSIFISTASGSAMEAVACGKSVIIAGKPGELVACPLIDKGRGEIWDIVFSENELKPVFNKLRNQRNNNPKRISELASWYRENFFVQSNERFPIGLLKS